jgi:hypothetical protein
VRCHRLGIAAVTAVMVGSFGLVGSIGWAGAALAASPIATAPAWRAVPAPDPHHDAALFDDSCSSARACTAVGEASVGRGKVIIKSASATAGVVRPAGMGRVGGAESLGDGAHLAAPALQSPAAAGSPATRKTTFHGYAIATRWNGVGWRLQHLPAVAHTEFVELVSVACPTLVRCVAVGDAASSTTYVDRPVAATWNGKAWSWLTLPRGTTPLTAVTCTSASSCLALGPDSINEVFSGRVHIQPRAIRWNGHEWRTIDLAAGPSRTVPLLDAVSCLSARSCTAVGERVSELKPTKAHTAAAGAKAARPSSQHLLAERWNGLTWQVQTTPVIAGGADVDLVDVSCPTAMSCTAVGDTTTSADHTGPLVVRWGGIRWRRQLVPPANGQAFLSAVACIQVNECTAVGARKIGRSGVATLAETTTPSGWQLERTPVVAKPKRELLGVACRAEGPCFAVGAGGAGSLIEEN